VQDWLIKTEGNKREKVELGLRGWAKKVYSTTMANS